MISQQNPAPLSRFNLSRDQSRRWLSSCARCASILPPIDLFCANCWVDLAHEIRISRTRGLRRADYSLPVYSLLTWTPECDGISRALVHGFKGGTSWRAVHRLALELSVERKFLANPPLNPVFVPAPGKKMNHAKLFAQALGAIWRCPMVDAFLPPEPSSARQRFKNIEERAERRFHLRPGAGEKLSGRSIVFVDDVITSGSTAFAAFMALNDPSHFEVWTLANRPRLATRTSV